MKYIIYLILILSIVSCSSDHSIYINKDNSATVNFNVVNKQSLVDTLKEWGSIQSKETDSLIDLESLKDKLNKDPNIHNVSIENSKNNYSGNFSITNLNNLFSSKESSDKELNIFTITETNLGKKLEIKLSIENYIYLKQSLPILQEESIDMLGPDANQDISKEEYLDMMSFSLGDNGPKDILDSNISLKITIEGTITDITGGELLDNQSCLFEVPLLDIILLQKTFLYSVTYK